MKRLMLTALIVVSTIAIAPPDLRALDCDTTKDNIICIEALCLYAEKSALEGHFSSNPLRLQAISDYARAKDQRAEMLLSIGALDAYFGPCIKTIHNCYAHKKINLCDVFRGD
jgi:hypothetical protein